MQMHYGQLLTFNALHAAATGLLRKAQIVHLLILIGSDFQSFVASKFWPESPSPTSRICRSLPPPAMPLISPDGSKNPGSTILLFLKFSNSRKSSQELAIRLLD
ncbi:uncharacterized protein ZBIST_0461 [Zygosaccharomyces bailii]|nr:uncharacterized protein ZBIST_0461 [Zygosaccharomyces bailii]